MAFRNFSLRAQDSSRYQTGQRQTNKISPYIASACAIVLTGIVISLGIHIHTIAQLCNAYVDAEQRLAQSAQAHTSSTQDIKLRSERHLLKVAGDAQYAAEIQQIESPTQELRTTWEHAQKLNHRYTKKIERSIAREAESSNAAYNIYEEQMQQRANQLRTTQPQELL